MAELFAKSITMVLALVGTSFLIPVFVAWYYGEYLSIVHFALPMAASWAAACRFWIKRRNGERGRAGARNTIAIVGGTWVAMSLFGAVPLYLSGCFPSFVDAFFESVSGFTTTGASVLSDVESLPRAVNFWRCQTHWIGGMGIIALAVAILHVVGGGAQQLIQAEASGPEKGKLTSRISDTAKILWFIYIVLTAAQALLLKYFGMGWYDAVAHSFSTLGTGGFSTRNASIASFANPAAEWICTLFMLLASVNFGVYYLLLTRRRAELREHTELRAFVFVVVPVILAVSLLLVQPLGTVAEAFRAGAFQVASIISTTGFMSNDYLTWPPAAQFLILLLFFTGGCSGSTAGGIKLIRWAVLAKELRNGIYRLIHPHGVVTLRINGVAGRSEIVGTVGSFIFVYFALVFLTALCGTFCGQDILTAFTAALSMVGNVGPAFGQLGPTANYGSVCPFLKCVYSFAMLAGRLEVYTLLILVGQSVRARR